MGRRHAVATEHRRAYPAELSARFAHRSAWFAHHQKIPSVSYFGYWLPPNCMYKYGAWSTNSEDLFLTRLHSIQLLFLRLTAQSNVSLRLRRRTGLSVEAYGVG